ncbi:hypothetical protein [Brevibacillus sp. H7]|uniref:hypothetical protein n=1 Tax=Brevibacillus sp. H7 TaxID=3349138 RepID=UPI00382FFCD4
MREDERLSLQDEHDATIAQLLTHLQQLRRSVPVNYQLKADLKERLLQRMKELEINQQDTLHAQLRRKRRVAWWLSGAIALTLASALGIWTSSPLKVTEPALLTMSTPSAAEQVDINPDGSYIAYVSADARIYMKSLEEKGKEGKVGLPHDTGTYQSLSWANNNQQLAVVEQKGPLSRLWLVDLASPGIHTSSRLLKEESGAVFRVPAWSPANDQIAYAKVVSGKEELWITSTVSFHERKLTEGGQPEWSPDGRQIAFVKGGSVSVIELATGNITALGTGSWPSWQSDDRLTYTTREGRLAEVQMDAHPPVTTLVPVGNLSNEKLVRANWAADKKHLLLAHQTDEQPTLVFSLAR